MDAECVDVLDKKFRKVDERFDTLHIEFREELKEVRAEIHELRQSVNSLANAVDHFVHLHEKLKVEQAAMIADLNRIKSVIKEKLGVEI